MRVRRCLMFMPGDSRRKIEKGAASGVDSVIMDLEDGVALANKAAAREVIVSALREIDFGRTEKLVRVNPFGSAWYQADLDAVLPAKPDGIVLPKVETPQAVDETDAIISQFEGRNGIARGSISMLIMIETARGIVNLREIAGTSPRVKGIIFGAEDFAASIGAQRTPDGWEVFYARSAVVTYAKAFGLQAIDQVHVALDDEPGLISDTEQARYMGYDGKQAIHPNQIEPIQRTFTPTAEELDRAQRLVNAFERHQAEGAGAFAFEGQMVDMPVLRAAESVIARARAAGLG